jgi:hypothetical protein
MLVAARGSNEKINTLAPTLVGKGCDIYEANQVCTAGTSLCLFHSHPPARTFHHTHPKLNALIRRGEKRFFKQRGIGRCLLPIERERYPKM